jgi:hypothetical protein
VGQLIDSASNLFHAMPMTLYSTGRRAEMCRLQQRLCFIAADGGSRGILNKYVRATE